MNVEELVKQARNGTEAALKEVGRALFTGAFDTGAFITAMLDAEAYTALAEVMSCGFISKQYKDSDFVSSVSGDLTIGGRYFDLFMELCAEYGVPLSKILPVLFVDAPAGSALKSWSKAIDVWLVKRAYANFGEVADWLAAYDTHTVRYDALLISDRAKTTDLLLDKLIHGKNVNKTRIRKFFLEHKIDVFPTLKATYDGADAKTREAVVRVLLLYKNDARVSLFLDNVYELDKSVTVRRLFEKDRSAIERAAPLPGAKELQKTFYEAMVSGKSVSAAEFKRKLSDKDYAAVAGELFFSVYQGGTMTDIVIVDNGKILDLDNRPKELDGNLCVKVFHPVELTSKYAYLRQLNIEQPFEQIHRSVYVPTDEEKQYNTCRRLKGTIMRAAEFKKAVREGGFKVLNKNIDEETSQAGKVRGGILCVLDYLPVNLNQPGRTVTAGEIRFYDYKDVVKLNGQMYTDGVPLYPIARLPERMFSEFIHNIYEVLGC